MSPRNCPAVASLLVALTTACLTARAQEGVLPPAADRAVDFEKDVRPIFAKSCHRCHGAKKQEGGLRLHVKSSALAGGDGGPVIVPGKGEESRLLRFVAGMDEDHVMPPEGAASPLTAEQVGLLRAWIDGGAAWPDDAGASAAGPGHWAFRKPAPVETPPVADATWARNPIDRFVLARLEREGLRPSPEADRATLIRRLSLDLVGLPPTIAEADAFIADPRPDAYERLVDRLLASPRYGERWARRWLDRARYADTNGYEKDRERSIWPYRDWVIRVLNEDMPFDRFTVEQIAGDLLPDAGPSQRIATGFHRNTMTNEEGGIDVEEFRFASVVDRVQTTGTVWLGLTIGCAQCHSHKYDPITQREYYQFFAFFNNADEPDIDVISPETARRRDEAEALVAQAEAELEGRFPVPNVDTPSEDQRRQRIDERLSSWETDARSNIHAWTTPLPARVVSRKNATLTVLPDRSVLATGDKPNIDTYEIDLPLDGLAPIRAIRIEVLPHESLPDGGPGRAPLFSVGDFLLSGLEAQLVSGGDPVRPLALQNATQDYSDKDRPASLAIDVDRDTGWTVKGAVGKPHAAVFELAEDVAAPAGSTLRLVLDQHGIHQMTIGRFRVSVTSDARPVRASGLPAEIESILTLPRDGRSNEQSAAVRRYFLANAPELKEQHDRIEVLRKAVPKYPTSMVMEERAPAHRRTSHIHGRGEFLKLGDPVEPGVPASLPPLPDDGSPRDRLALARWIASSDNPLTARIYVNQLWQAYFGRGLVGTVEDFGTRGEKPSHPELLDWLASELIRQGWGQKAMHRLIVTSATYRQGSRVPTELLSRDPRNDLLARGPRFRVDAEVVRDLALTASGLLSPRIGGPSVYPPQPEGVTALAYGQMAWPVSTGLDRYRRGLYTFTKRTAPYAAFTVMDAPTSDTTCVRRERSNTPLQALTLLNDTVFVEASRTLARRALAEATTPESRLRRAFRLCLTREPTADEQATLAAFLADQLARFRSGDLDAAKVVGSAEREGEDMPEVAAWTVLARALLNLDETITNE